MSRVRWPARSAIIRGKGLGTTGWVGGWGASWVPSCGRAAVSRQQDPHGVGIGCGHSPLQTRGQRPGRCRFWRRKAEHRCKSQTSLRAPRATAAGSSDRSASWPAWPWSGLPERTAKRRRRRRWWGLGMNRLALGRDAPNLRPGNMISDSAKEEAVLVSAVPVRIEDVLSGGGQCVGREGIVADSQWW